MSPAHSLIHTRTQSLCHSATHTKAQTISGKPEELGDSNVYFEVPFIEEESVDTRHNQTLPAPNNLTRDLSTCGVKSVCLLAISLHEGQFTIQGEHFLESYLTTGLFMYAAGSSSH